MRGLVTIMARLVVLFHLTASRTLPRPWQQANATVDRERDADEPRRASARATRLKRGHRVQKSESNARRGHQKKHDSSARGGHPKKRARVGARREHQKPEAPREARRHEQTVARGLTSPREWLARWQARATADRYRPANATLTRAPTLIPPMMFHLSYTPEEALAANGGLMRGWRELNPEYDYHIFSERDCVEFVRAFGSAEDARAYAAIAMGAQHADVCRAHVLLHLGGVYADADLELRRPLRELVPANASAANLAGGGVAIWPYTFLAFSVRHPIIERHVGRMTAAILVQVALLEAGELNDAASCRDARSCVLEITGPMAFHRSYESLACRGESGGGWPSKRLPVASWPCVRSSDAQMAGVFWSSVDKDQSHDAKPLEHHTCSRRSSRSERECGASHYSHGDTAASYFIASPSTDRPRRDSAARLSPIWNVSNVTNIRGGVTRKRRKVSNLSAKLV